jgi:hypothetical protein
MTRSMMTRSMTTHTHLPAVSPTELLKAKPELGRYAQDGAIIVAENFIDELQANPSIAHLIMERFLDNDAEMSLVFGDSAVTHDIHYARYVYFITKWMWYFNIEKKSFNDLIDMFYEDPEWTVLKPCVTNSLLADLIYKQRNSHFANHMRLLCDYVCANIDIAREMEGLTSVICEKVLEMTWIPEFEKDGLEFLSFVNKYIHKCIP